LERRGGGANRRKRHGAEEWQRRGGRSGWTWALREEREFKKVVVGGGSVG